MSPGRRLQVLGFSCLLGSVVAWGITLFGSYDGGDTYWVHLTGRCVKRCGPSVEDWIYAIVLLVIPPVLGGMFLWLASRKALREK
jgi:hypothetical protein